MSAHIPCGDATGHHSDAQISLKWHLRQTSSDKEVPFLCPLPQLTTTSHCAPRMENVSDGGIHGNRNNLWIVKRRGGVKEAQSIRVIDSLGGV